MAMTYRHRNCAAAAGDTWYLMNLDGTLATPGPLVVPTGMRRISQIIFTPGDTAPTAATCNMGAILKLVGVDAGEALLAMSAFTSLLAGAGGNSGVQYGPMKFDVDIPVTPGKQISPYVCFTLGVDASTPQADVTLGFSST
jgi:hypothetical protein